MLVSELALNHSAGREPWWDLLFLTLLLTFGLSGLVLGIWALVEGWASEDWPAVEVRVVEAWVHEHHHIRGGPRYEPVVRYTYRQNGVEFEGSRVAFGEFSLRDLAEAERFVDRVKTASRTLAWVHPNKPRRAVLLPGWHDRMWWRLLFFTFFTGMVGLMLVGAWRSLA